MGEREFILAGDYRLLDQLYQRLANAEAQIQEAMETLNPTNPNETLVGAIRNLQQVALSAMGNYEEVKALALYAFVDGAKWWEWEKTGATMWQSDVDKAERVARERYPFAPHFLLRAAELEAERLREELARVQTLPSLPQAEAKAAIVPALAALSRCGDRENAMAAKALAALDQLLTGMKRKQREEAE